jgi:hypothetical protein
MAAPWFFVPYAWARANPIHVSNNMSFSPQCFSGVNSALKGLDRFVESIGQAFDGREFKKCVAQEFSLG